MQQVQYKVKQAQKQIHKPSSKLLGWSWSQVLLAEAYPQGTIPGCQKWFHGEDTLLQVYNCCSLLVPPTLDCHHWGIHLATFWPTLMANWMSSSPVKGFDQMFWLMEESWQGSSAIWIKMFRGSRADHKIKRNNQLWITYSLSISMSRTHSTHSNGVLFSKRLLSKSPQLNTLSGLAIPINFDEARLLSQYKSHSTCYYAHQSHELLSLEFFCHDHHLCVIISMQVCCHHCCFLLIFHIWRSWQEKPRAQKWGPNAHLLHFLEDGHKCKALQAMRSDDGLKHQNRL